MDKYLLLNRGVLQPQGMDNLKLVVAQIEKDTENNPLFYEDFFSDPPRKWEPRYDNAYPNVIYDEKYKKYRCYYTLCSKDKDSASASREERTRRDYRPSPTRIASLGYAESDDGVHWEKPNLGFVDFEGSFENNLLFRYAHGTGVFLDKEETDPAKRYKMVTKVEYPGHRTYMAVNFSEDGVHWGEMIQWPRWNPPADSHNFPFRDKVDGLFKVITRTWKNGVRISAICSSRDFINWSEPREILRGDGFESQVYSMPVFWYDGLYLGLASMFHEGDRSDLLQVRPGRTVPVHHPTGCREIPHRSIRLRLYLRRGSHRYGRQAVLLLHGRQRKAYKLQRNFICARLSAQG